MYTQGNVLGHLLFLLFINDIADIFCENLTVKIYATDVKIYTQLLIMLVRLLSYSNVSRIYLIGVQSGK